VVQARHGRIRVVQGNLELEARLLEEVRSPLKAPGKYTFFSFKTDRASFEYEY
jgi:hypothetical protein